MSRWRLETNITQFRGNLANVYADTVKTVSTLRRNPPVKISVLVSRTERFINVGYGPFS